MDKNEKMEVLESEASIKPEFEVLELDEAALEAVSGGWGDNCGCGNNCRCAIRLR